MTLRNPTPEDLIRTYIRAKDENRPHLMEHVFAADAKLGITVMSETISFPPVTRGLASITEVLVRNFALNYENIYTFCMERPPVQARERGFTCDWMVGMSERTGGRVRVGCGRYEWGFSAQGLCLVERLTIVIEVMQIFASGCARDAFTWLSELPYPWCTSERIVKTVPAIEGMEAVTGYITRSGPDR